MLRKASLVGLVLGALAACGGSRERGPAWPKPHEREADGGESLAPRQASSVAAIEAAEDATPVAAGPDADAAPAAPGSPASSAASGKADKPAAAEAPPPKEPDVLSTEEIIIEIEDD